MHREFIYVLLMVKKKLLLYIAYIGCKDTHSLVP